MKLRAELWLIQKVEWRARELHERAVARELTVRKLLRDFAHDETGGGPPLFM